jgi:hypothetical protein
MVGATAHTTVPHHAAGENHIIATQLLSVRKQPQGRRGARGDETNEPCRDREGISLPQGSGGGRRAHVLRRAAARRRRRRGLEPWIGPGSATPWRGPVWSEARPPVKEGEDPAAAYMMAFVSPNHLAHDRPTSTQPTSKVMRRLVALMQECATTVSGATCPEPAHVWK